MKLEMSTDFLICSIPLYLQRKINLALIQLKQLLILVKQVSLLMVRYCVFQLTVTHCQAIPYKN
jgi:hypothetical protein